MKYRLLAAIGIAAGVLGMILFGRYSYGMYQAKKMIEAQIKEKSSIMDISVNRDESIKVYNGKSYIRRSAVKAVLCIGIDTSGEMEERKVSGTAGQADGIFLIAQDMSADTVKILMIPRDTMTEIKLFDLAGNELGKDIQHITLAFAYGDGREKSCELMCDAVSNLLGGLSINGYACINTSAISVLNDAVGGVTVTINDGKLEQRDPELKKGSAVTLNGKQAELFVRYRDIQEAQSAIDRMSRQKQYMESYLEIVQTKSKTDDGLISRLMDVVQGYMITNLTKDQYMDIALSAVNGQVGSSQPRNSQVGNGLTESIQPGKAQEGYSKGESGQSDVARMEDEEEQILILPGTAVETQLYDEYHPDQNQITEMILQLFYREIS